ncbi:MAG: glycosyltransferase family 2 protein [Bacilli bacterium]|nr:glycosyltransferase family 2 protein [Bacilli bacterium]
MIDILMATYNGEKYLKEQIDSILNQTYSKFTLHISDDKSTDKTVHILKEYANKDKRIKLYFQKQNIGYIKNFEYLISKSKADYIMLSDQDDVWLDNKVEVCLEKIKNDKLNLLISNLIIVDENLNVKHDSYFKLSQVKLDNNLELGNYLYANPAVGCAMMFDKKLAKELLPFPDLKHPYYVHDWYIYIMGQIYGKVGYIDTPLTKYRQHGNNLIGMHRKKTKDFKFIIQARTINLNYRIDFCDALLTKVHNKKRKEIIAFKLYLMNLRDTKFINFNLIKTNKYLKLVGLKRKILYIIPFHFPLFILSEKKIKNE